MNIIAIDCGRSFIKGAYIDEQNGEIIRTKLIGAPEDDADGDFSIERTLDCVKSLIGELAREDTAVNVCFATEMHGFVAADKDGKPLCDYISWKNECAHHAFRDGSYLDYMKKMLTEKEVMSTGMPLKAGLPNVNLFYLMQNALKDVPAREVFFYTLGDYLIRGVSGKEPLIHPTSAAATGLFDLETCRWNEKILRKTGLQDIHFPEISRGRSFIEAELDRRQLFLFPAIGDQQAALLGSSLLEEDTLSVNLGTGGQVSVLTKSKVFSNGYQTRPYFYDLYLKTLPHIPSGRALNVYFHFVQELIRDFMPVEDDKIWDYIMRKAEESSREDLDIDLSFFSNPLSDAAGGAVSSIQEGAFGIGNLFRSIYRQMAVNVRKAVDKLEIGDYEKLIFSGGVARKTPLLRKFILEELAYSGVYEIAENETLKGLYRYLKSLGYEG